MTIPVKNIPLQAGEYGTEQITKDTIYLHHTAGGHRPDWVVNGWNEDRNKSGMQLRVATSYVIGGISTTDHSTDWDGVIVQCFPEDLWAQHLGTTQPNNTFLNQKSIGIEICNYGPLTLSRDGTFYNYVNKPVPAEMVVDLGTLFRGYRYYHKYTAKQIETLRLLLTGLSNKFNIDLKAGLQKYTVKSGLKIPPGLTTLQRQQWLNQHGYTGKNGKALIEDGDEGGNTQFACSCVGLPPFEEIPEAMEGFPGLWTHANVRADKFDCSPQPDLIEMIRSL